MPPYTPLDRSAATGQAYGSVPGTDPFAGSVSHRRQPPPSVSTGYAAAGTPSASSPTMLHSDAAPTSASPAAMWDTRPEPDDFLHNPDPKDDKAFGGIDLKGIVNIVTVALILCGILMLFAGYPILDHYLAKERNLLQLNGSGQIPALPNMRQLIDPDTPDSAKTWTSAMDGTKYSLVFSDEFEQEGRTFWPGDDPFWEAVDIYYGATNDYEWYAPEAVNTTGGTLQLTMTQKDTHNLNFQSGMVQSWNKFCFQGGYLEMSAKLPGREDTRGFWPGLWTMGNLGRPGYLGSTDGMWPYSYAACDWGTLPNQTNPEGTAPKKALHANGPYSYQYQNRLSYLPGMRTSSCTCPGEDHPGPNVGVARSAPEIDIIEAQNSKKVGQASQSLQVAPYDADYWWHNASATFWNGTEANSYTGSVYQEAVSGIAPIPSNAYIEADGSVFTTFGIEVVPDWDLNGGGSITWYLGGVRTWHAPSAVVPANEAVNISRRIIPVEPMSIIMNLGISAGFQGVYFDEITFPAKMQIDYVRLYQKAGEEPKVSCDPPDHPTKDYINNHLDLYMNPNHSVFPKDIYPWPKNRLLDTC